MRCVINLHEVLLFCKSLRSPVTMYLHFPSIAHSKTRLSPGQRGIALTFEVGTTISAFSKNGEVKIRASWSLNPNFFERMTRSISSMSAAESTGINLRSIAAFTALYGSPPNKRPEITMFVSMTALIKRVSLTSRLLLRL